jgi:signal peptidase II
MKTKKAFLIAGIIVLLDQITKYIVKATGKYITNTGIAFGLLPDNNPVLIMLTLVIILGLIYCAYRHPSLGIALLVGGAIGNFLDRLVLGHVIDFIQIGWWPSFNIADAANSIGVILLLFTKPRTYAKPKKS